MLKRLIIVVAAVFVTAATSSFAKDMTGKISLGFHDSDAPIGVRFWTTDNVAIDVGAGFKSNSVVVTDPVTDETSTEHTGSFWFETGVPIKLYDADNAHFFARPSVVIGILDDRDYGTGTTDAKWSSLDLILSLGGELFFGDHFSVEATHGVKLNYTSVPDDVQDDVGAESLTSFETFGNNLTTIGFHFYF
jgi:hypothetical protein